MINEVKRLAKRSEIKTMEAGTGNSSLPQLALYQKYGFRMHRIDAGHLNSYPEPIFEIVFFVSQWPHNIQFA